MKADYAIHIVTTLRQAGHEAYFVGGSVRDMVLGIEPSDYDIATAARPEQVMELFPRTEPIGARFGVVLVIHRGVPFEVATFRSDEAYVDGRRPTSVVFTGAREDVLRRDFTINGLLYDPIARQVIDYVGGQDDIRARVVRAIGNPRERFTEDKLRILRAVRFGARLGYTIEPETWAAVCAMAPEVGQVSQERIRDELVRILREGQAAHGVRLLEESGLARVILPEWSRTDPLGPMLEMLTGPVSVELGMATLLHECSPAVVQAITRRLRFSVREAAHIVALVAGQHRFDDVGLMSPAALKRFLRTARFGDHLELYRLRSVARLQDPANLRFIRDKLEEWSPEDLFPPRLISGEDLINLGFRPGPAFNHILTAVEDEQLEGRLTGRDAALAFVRSRFA
jgi:poly(A) polymerase